ncbi:MAG TPA: hypothetical protein DD737_03685 [Ruminococcaceae bacterium]|jgi:ribose transport system substrate-binding protein|nr:hypothetical protein [Oscillospiraceae bacterium]
MKRGIALLLVLALLLGEAGCLAGFGAKREYAVDLIVKGTNMDFWKSVNEGAQAAASDYRAAVTMTGPAIEKDYRQQAGILKDSVARRPDAIVLAAADYEKMAQPVQDAIDAGIPVVMVDSDVNNSRTAAYVGTNNLALGRTLADRLCRQIKGSGEVGIVSFMQNSYPAIQREKGFRDAISANRRFTVLNTVYGYSDSAQAEKVTEELIARHPKLKAVAALNQWSSEGAARALSKLGRKDVRLFAIDCSPELAMYMEEGVLSMVLLQNPYQMGYDSVETACRCLRGEKVGDKFTDIYSVDITTLFDDKYEQLIFPFES